MPSLNNFYNNHIYNYIIKYNHHNLNRIKTVFAQDTMTKPSSAPRSK